MPKRITTEDFLERSHKVWGDRWDYSETIYVDSVTKVRVKCREHGTEFAMLPGNHLKSVGCPDCQVNKPGSTEEFLSRAVSVWGDRWDYSNTEYKNNHDKVTIVCREHGEFTQHPRSHIKGFVGCNKCSKWVGDTSSFVQAGDTQWGTFDYSKTVYTYARDKVVITCPEHGDFEQVADSHLRGFNGCAGCWEWGTSNLEKEVIDYIDSLDVEYCLHDRGSIGLELDILVPSIKVAIEVNGVYYHSSKFKDKNFHANKTKLSREAGIRLLHIWEDDWNNKTTIVKSHIASVLGKSNSLRVGARKTEVVYIPHSEASSFLDTYHIQGSVNASFHIGLKYKEDLVAVASFRKSGKDLTLSRYASNLNVQGGCSKIVKFVETNHQYRNLVTFADLTFSYGNLYEKTGWTMDGYIQPSYSYLVNGTRVHKSNYRINRFKTDPQLSYQEGLTESELAEMNNLLRVYDSGKLRFVKPGLHVV